MYFLTFSPPKRHLWLQKEAENHTSSSAVCKVTDTLRKDPATSLLMGPDYRPRQMTLLTVRREDQETEISDDDAQKGIFHLFEWDAAASDFPTGRSDRKCSVNHNNEWLLHRFKTKIVCQILSDAKSASSSYYQFNTHDYEIKCVYFTSFWLDPSSQVSTQWL